MAMRAEAARIRFRRPLAAATLRGNRPQRTACMAPVLAACLCVWQTGRACAQMPAAERAPDPAEELIELNFPGEIEVKTFADYVSERLKISILYDESIRGKRITVRSPQPIPVSSLMSLLRSTLRVKNLALIPAGAKNWYRIVEISRLTDVAEIRPATDDDDQSGPVTETFILDHQNVQQLDQVIKQFLTQPGGNSIAIAESNLLIITDYAPNLVRIRTLIESLDQPPSAVVRDFYNATNVSAEEACEAVRPILNAGLAGGSAGQIELLPEARTNQIVIVGTAADVLTAKALLERFDVPLGLHTAVYPLARVPAARVNKIFQELIDPIQRKSLYQATIDDQANLLIVRTTADLHERLGQLCSQLDSDPAPTRSPVQFLKLKNANVDEILRTLRALSDVGGFPPGMEPPEAAAVAPEPVAIVPDSGAVVASPLPLPVPPANLDDGIPGAGRQLNSLVGVLLPGGVRAAGDELTNSIILVGDASAQSAYVELIHQLDTRRPQVMIEAHIVAIDTSDNFSLGVEVSGGDREGANRLFQFTSFGLSEVNPITGALQIIPNLGFNGTLVNPDVADVVVQAVVSHSRAHVLASPKILVNDNTRGRFQSVLSVPFQSVNASQTVSTTSLGGDQQAGTSINVTPHIKQGHELELEFDVEFSSFSGSGGNGLPPPRQISRAESIVTIPDGHTVIVGGLKQIGTAASFSGVPYLEFVPLLREISSLRSDGQTTTSFFLFIKPVVIRDSQFAELKYLSSPDIVESGVPARFPPSAPIMIRSRPEDDD